MIILEGTDKAGKTTFISNLLRFFPSEIQNEIKVFHFGLLPNNWDYCDDYINYIRPNVILDRFVDSERAYGQVFRGQINPKLTTSRLNKVYRKCYEIGALTVYCNPNVDEVMNRVNKEGDEMIKKRDQLDLLRSTFDSAVFNEKYPLELEIVDTTKKIDIETYKRIVNKSLILERSAKTIKNLGFRGYISPSSKYIFYVNELETITNLINIFYDKPISDFSIILSRDTENKPVNISPLVASLPAVKRIYVYGRDAENDYLNAENMSSAEVIFKHKIIAKRFLDLNKN